MIKISRIESKFSNSLNRQQKQDLQNSRNDPYSNVYGDAVGSTILTETLRMLRDSERSSKRCTLHSKYKLTAYGSPVNIDQAPVINLKSKHSGVLNKDLTSENLYYDSSPILHKQTELYVPKMESRMEEIQENYCERAPRRKRISR